MPSVADRVGDRRKTVNQAGYRLAQDGLSQLLTQAQTWAARERGNRELANQTEVLTLQTECGFLTDARECLLQQVQQCSRQPLNGDRRPSPWNLLIAAILISGGFVVALQVVKPFGLGLLASYAFCASLSVAIPCGVHRLLEKFPHPWVEKAIVLVTFFTGIAALALFGALRGDVLLDSLNAGPVILDGPGTTNLVQTPSNADGLIASMRLVWSLASLTFEFSCAMILHDFADSRKPSTLGVNRAGIVGGSNN